MVFRWRCFSFKYDYETKTQTNSTTSEAFYTAPSGFNQSKSVLNAKTSEFSEDSANNPSNLRVFTVAELKAATRNFSRSRNIGEGGFGSVYRGVIKSLEHPFDEIQVAVKFAKERGQGIKEWLAEVNVLGVIEHQNLVKLVGYCDNYGKRGIELFLVYEYMPNRSVRDHLFTKSEAPLSWAMRLKVAQDTARGLAYLHEEMDFQIILRDFKSSNILLDDQWNAKLSDFGTARLGPPDGYSSVISSFVGTIMYAAPEHIQTGTVSTKIDVWSYGVFLYELITGRPPIDRTQPRGEQKLLDWVRPYLASKRFHDIIDPRLEGMWSLKSAKRLAIIANSCLLNNPRLRPKMSEVLEKVNELIGVPSQETSPASPLVPVLENTTHEGEGGSIGIQQLTESASFPPIRNSKSLKSWFRKKQLLSAARFGVRGEE